MSPPHDPTERNVAWLLGKTTVTDFLETHWCRASLLIRGEPDKFADFFSAEAFWKAVLSEEQVQTPTIPFYVRAGKTVITPGQAKGLFAEGLSLCANNLSSRSPALERFARAAEAELRFPGRARFNAYLSPDGTGFSGVHFDSRMATTLQIAGKKQWTYGSAPAVVWPKHQAFVRAGQVYWGERDAPTSWEAGQLEESRRRCETFCDQQVVLEPGDVLYLPAGTWHAAKAVEGTSLSLNLCFERAQLVDAVTRLLRRALEERDDWRCVSDLNDRSGLDLRLQELGAAVAAITAEDLQQELEEEL